MNLEWRIEELPETKLVGKGGEMTFSENKTRKLWQDFIPKVKNIKNRDGNELFSVEIYKDPFFFHNFDPDKGYEKYAAVKVSDFSMIPDNLEKITIPKGMYAVFLYKGKASEAESTYTHIFKTWLPESKYKLDDRPHLAIMGENYKNEDPNSEEELWIPIHKN